MIGELNTIIIIKVIFDQIDLPKIINICNWQKIKRKNRKCHLPNIKLKKVLMAKFHIDLKEHETLKIKSEENLAN